MKTKLFSIALVALSGTTAFAAKDAAPRYDYTCDIEAKRTGNWTPYRIKFSIDKDNMEVLVDPGFRNHETKGPLTVVAKPRKDGVIRFKWRLGLRTSEWDIMSIGYKVDFDPQDKSGRMWVAVPSGGLRDGPGTLRCK